MTALLNNFSDSMKGMKKQIQANRFLRWWLGQLFAMVPGWMRSSSLTIDHYVLLPLDQIDSNMRKPVVEAPSVVAITLSASQVLRKTVLLPFATEENLGQVLAFQMEQHTPFPPDKIYFGYMVRSRDFETGQLTVEFVAAPRDAVDRAIKILLALGVEVRAVFPDELLPVGTLLNLLPVALGATPSPLRYGANPWLAMLVGLLALAALAMPLVIKREAVVQLLPFVEKSRQAAEIVTSKRNELDAQVKQHNFLLEKRQMTPTVIQILEELTHVLPDDTWVKDFDLKDKKVTIQGETGSSSLLIGVFEKSNLFRDASFSSPLFKGQAPNTERYQLTVQLRPPAVPASAPLHAASASLAPAANAASSALQKVGVQKP